MKFADIDAIRSVPGLRRRSRPAGFRYTFLRGASVESGDGSISRPVNPDFDPDRRSPEPAEPFSGVALTTSPGCPLHPRLQAMILAARHHGVELDANEFRPTAGEAAPSAAALSDWAQNAGMWSRAVRIRWRHLLRFQEGEPVVLLFTDGTAGLLAGANAER